MEQHLIRGTAMGGQVRILAADTTAIVEQLRLRHQASPVAIAALGRTATAGVMMGAMLKGDEHLTIQIKGDGPLGQIVVDANAKGDVRGYVQQPIVDLPLNARGKLDVAAAVGQGELYVIKDLGMREPYRGSVPIVSGEIAEDFTYYFAKSEQTPSAVALGVLVNTDYSIQAAGGFILQPLPGLTDEELAGIEHKLSTLPYLTSMMAEGESMESILHRIVDNVEIMERMPIRFQCKCSRERVEQTLVSLGRQELQQIWNEDGQAEIVCHFCNEAYQFAGEDLQTLLDRM